MEKTFEEWLTATEPIRTTLINYSKTPFAADMLQQYESMDKIIRAEDQMANLIADATFYLAQHKAKALLSVKEKYPKMPSRERETLEEAEVAGIVRLIDGLKATENTFTSRRYNAPGKVR